MSKVDIDDTILAENMLVAKNKLECVIALRKLKFSSAAMLNIAIYMIVEKLNSKTGKCNPKEKTIAAKTGYHIDTVKDMISGLKERGIIAATRKQKGSVQYFFAMPGASRLTANGGQSTPVAMGVDSPLSNGGRFTPIPYEVEKGTEEEEIEVGTGHRDGFAGPSDFSSPTGKETVAGSSYSSVVDSDIGKEKEREINLYAAMKDGEIEAYPIPATESDLTTFMKRIVAECGNLDSDALYEIRRKFMAGELTDADIDRARKAAA